MNILGFHYLSRVEGVTKAEEQENCHDTAAALVCDGELVVAAEEERFTRQKHESSVPLQAIEFCLKFAGISMSDVDIIAYPDLPFRTGPASQHAELELSFFKQLRADHQLRLRSLLHKRGLDLLRMFGLSFNLQMCAPVSQALGKLRKVYGPIPPVLFYDHHRAHAAAAFFTSGLDRSAVMTVDGMGGLCSSVTWEGRENHLRRIRAEPYYNSLGYFYSACTRYLGFANLAEGKMMGLASYGDYKDCKKTIAPMLDVSGPRWYKFLGEPDPSFLGFQPRKGEDIVRPPYTDFASSVQYALQGTMQRIAKSALQEAPSHNLCLGGGVTLNCTSNGALRDSGLCSSVWVFSAAGDAGLSAGAALLAAAEAGELKRTRVDCASLGPEFGPEECERALRAAKGLRYWRVPDVADAVAARLSAGEVVGWFQGRMEFGPRALGNRSILADPRRREMTDRVNKIKGREPWRPLSPAVLAERANDFFTMTAPSPFMLFATQVRPEMRSLIPAVVHVDGSARPQTVTRAQNPEFYDLLLAFSLRTGIPVLLNTSFNSAGEPIVCTPEDAIKTFLAAGIDTLVLGEFMACEVNRHLSSETATTPRPSEQNIKS